MIWFEFIDYSYSWSVSVTLPFKFIKLCNWNVRVWWRLYWICTQKYLKMNELNWIRIHMSVVWWQDCVISLPTENDSATDCNRYYCFQKIMKINTINWYFLDIIVEILFITSGRNFVRKYLIYEKTWPFFKNQVFDNHFLHENGLYVCIFIRKKLKKKSGNYRNQGTWEFWSKGIREFWNIANSLLKYILTFCSCHLMFYICNSFNWIVVNFKLKGWFSQVYSLNVSRLLVHQINWIDLRSDFFVFITFATDWDI